MAFIFLILFRIYRVKPYFHLAKGSLHKNALKMKKGKPFFASVQCAQQLE